MGNIKPCNTITLIGLEYGAFNKETFITSKKREELWVSSDVVYIRHLIIQTIANPDQTEPHKDDYDKIVLKKNYSVEIGKHGYTKKSCYNVTVILDKNYKRLITAFPTP